MDPSASNTLNRSVQGLWSSHRRARINLNNANTPPASTPNPTDSTVNTSGVDASSSSPNNLLLPDPISGSQHAVDINADATPDTETPDAVRSPASSNKRKTRSSRLNGTESGPHKRPKPSASGSSHTPPSTRLSDLGGVQSCVEKMLELVAMPLCHPEVYLHTGVQPPRGVLLHGPPGCGKTLLANAIAGELGVPFISVAAPSIVSGMSGESEKTLRDTFEEAKRVAPCLLFIDEIDAITPKRESAQREMERRIVAQFLTCMDELSWEKTDNRPVIVIGATNRPDSLDAALRRAGRFDHEITMSIPDEEAREQILRVQSTKLRLSGDFDFRALAKSTPGYVGADLAALTGAAGVIAVKRIFKGLAEGTITLPPDMLPITEESEMMIDDTIPVISTPSITNPPTTPFSSVEVDGLPQASIIHFLRAHPNPLTEEQLSPLQITMEDFHHALSEVQPSSKREGFATVPDVNWADVGALDNVREELSMSIVQPLRRPELFKLVGVDAPCGVLLWGPPGCGKTLLAKAVANESRANFISVKGPELLNKYVGESERAVRQVFSRARASSPCVIFFDELDALVPRRDDSLSESSSRVVNTLLTELDGLESRGTSVYIIAATNRPDMIDPAMCRPGRLDKLLYVDLPNPEERVEILRTVVGAGRRSSSTKGRNKKVIPIKGGFDGEVFRGVEELVRMEGDGYSGADIASFVREAALGALRSRLGKLGTDGEVEDLQMRNSSTPSEIPIELELEDFKNALDKVGPSVSAAQRKKYKAMQNKLAGLPVRSDLVKRPEIDTEAAG